MFTNFLKISLHNFLKNKAYALINLLGLAVGLASILLIFLFVRHELGFDKFHPGAERTYRLSLEFDGRSLWASNSYWLIPSLLESMPEIETGARLMQTSIPVQRGEALFSEGSFVLADPEIFSLFDFRWLQGDQTSALAQPFTAVLTENMARKYFGDENPIGQTLIINNQAPVTVTGVIADLPDNTHLKADFFTTMQTGVLAYGEAGLSGAFDFHSYVRLQPGSDIEALSNRITELGVARMGPVFQGRTRTVPTRLSDVHFIPMDNELTGSTPGSMALVYVFSSIALGILLIACVNFVNLTTARSSQRAKEVGMRKAVGAARMQLVWQFIGESVLMALLSAVIALVLAEIMLPVFQVFTGKQVASGGLLAEPGLVLSLFGLAAITGLVAGCYPALHLSAYEPGKVLRGEVHQGEAGLLFRNVLVMFQFSIAIVLLVSVAVIYTQMRYANNIDPGYDKEKIVVLTGSTTERLGTQWEAMKQRLLSNPDITRVTASSTIPGPLFGTPGWSIQYEGGADKFDISFMSVDFNFFETYGIELLAGRTFDESRPDDRLRFAAEGNGAAYILNEMAVRELGWTPEEAIGKWISWGEENGPRGLLVGVLDDVYFASLRSPRTPLLYVVGRSQYQVMSFNYASIAVTGNNLPQTLEFIDATWKEFMPGHPSSRSFLDQNLELMYRDEQQQGELMRYFAILAVTVACLGLYGLAAFNAERRTKEIGVRKVMGGSVWSIVLLLTNDFSKLVLVSNVVAWPIAYFAMQRWLENFAYRIDLTPLVFLGSGLIALCIAWVTVGGTAAKAASQKPVLALRYE